MTVIEIVMMLAFFLFIAVLFAASVLKPLDPERSAERAYFRRKVVDRLLSPLSALLNRAERHQPGRTVSFLLYYGIADAVIIVILAVLSRRNLSVLFGYCASGASGVFRALYAMSPFGIITEVLSLFRGFTSLDSDLAFILSMCLSCITVDVASYAVWFSRSKRIQAGKVLNRPETAAGRAAGVLTALLYMLLLFAISADIPVSGLVRHLHDAPWIVRIPALAVGVLLLAAYYSRVVVPMAAAVLALVVYFFAGNVLQWTGAPAVSAVIIGIAVAGWYCGMILSAIPRMADRYTDYVRDRQKPREERRTLGLRERIGMFFMSFYHFELGPAAAAVLRKHDISLDG